MGTAKDPFSPRPTDKPQLTREQIADMHPLDVDQARREGRCDEAMRTPDPEFSRGKNPQKSRVGSGAQGRDFQAIVEAGKR